jgi:hypothetical protein
VLSEAPISQKAQSAADALWNYGTPVNFERVLISGERHRGKTRAYPKFTHFITYTPTTSDSVAKTIDRAFAGWCSVGKEGTSVSDRELSSLLDAFQPESLREGEFGRRYKSAAAELVELLGPTIPISTIARMCGVSDRGFRNWLEGGGIREKSSRRLMTVRALVRAAFLQMGRERALRWLEVPNPSLEMTTPIEAIEAGDLDHVFEMTLARQTPRRRKSILPEVDDLNDELSAQEDLAARGEVTVTEIYELL